MNKKITQPYLNIGIGKDYSINWYAKFLMRKFNIKLKIKYDKTKPDGMPRKCLDITEAKSMDGDLLVISTKHLKLL